MNQELLSRAESIRSRNAILESVPGSGYHDNDRDHIGRPNSPQAKGLPRISTHAVAFYGDRSVTFVGPCAARVYEALGAWLDDHKTTDASVFSEMTGTERKLLGIIPKLSLQSRDEGWHLAIWKDQWNDVLHAIQVQGVGLTGAPLEI